MDTCGGGAGSTLATGAALPFRRFRVIGLGMRSEKPHRSHSDSVQAKALQINLDARRFGTFAEIGAGQEVARWFFRVGGASGTVAKTMSAYDMAVSDAIYGPAQRYVSRQRLQAMLRHEYDLLRERLDNSRGDRTAFFVFANTVATSGYRSRNEGHGWLGIRFQSQPRSEPSEILIHVSLLDREAEQQQETLGVIGVNLIHATFYSYNDPEALTLELLDDLGWQRVEVDMISFSGPDFAGVDNRLMALQLVKQGHTEAAMFTANGEAVQWAEVLYKRPVLVQRGSFRPMTHPMLDMLHCAERQFTAEPSLESERPIVLLEMTLRQLKVGDHIDHRDFLDRVDMLSALGKPVLISNFLRYHRLVGYLSRYTPKPIGLPLGMHRLRDVLDEKFYTDQPGGLMESLGQLFRKGVKLYAYPSMEASGELVTADTLEVAPNLRHLLAHLRENRLVESLRGYNRANLSVKAAAVLKEIQSGDPAWEAQVPAEVAEVIKAKGLFGYGH
jgi:hypothetical protein